MNWVLVSRTEKKNMHAGTDRNRLESLEEAGTAWNKLEKAENRLEQLGTSWNDTKQLLITGKKAKQLRAIRLN